jgi:hypothetical protein
VFKIENALSMKLTDKRFISNIALKYIIKHTQIKNYQVSKNQTNWIVIFWPSQEISKVSSPPSRGKLASQQTVIAVDQWKICLLPYYLKW